MNDRKLIFRVFGLVLLLCMIGITLWSSQSVDVHAIKQKMTEFGGFAWIAFIFFYAIGTVLFFPGSLLTLAGGALFGPILGTFINLAGATIGATLAFLIARYLAVDWVEKKLLAGSNS